MSYLKLGQILNQQNNVILYQEDCNGQILVANQTYPLVLECEVMDWASIEDFQSRQKLNPNNPQAFQSVNISLNVAPDAGKSIRQVVYEQLLQQFPSLNI